MKEERITYRNSNNTPIRLYVGFDDIPSGEGSLIQRAAKHAPPEAASLFVTGDNTQYFIDAKPVEYEDLTEDEQGRADGQTFIEGAAKLPIFRTRHGEIAVAIRNTKGEHVGKVIKTK